MRQIFRWMVALPKSWQWPIQLINSFLPSFQCIISSMRVLRSFLHGFLPPSGPIISAFLSGMVFALQARPTIFARKSVKLYGGPGRSGGGRRTWWTKPIDHPISSPINHPAAIYRLLPAIYVHLHTARGPRFHRVETLNVILWLLGAAFRRPGEIVFVAHSLPH